MKPVICPNFSVEALSARANSFITQANSPAAHELLEACLVQQPAHMPSVNEMANCLKGMGRHVGALDHYERALRMAPGTPELYQNLGATYLDLGDMQRAATHSITALAMDPRLEEARWNLAITLLSAGSLKEGWLQGRGRFLTPRFQKFMPKYRLPYWNGEDGAKVVVWGEQGLGERILFAPMVGELAAKMRAKGGAVYCDVDPRMMPMMTRSYPDVEFVLQGDVLLPGEATHNIAMGDLGQFFRTNLKDFPKAAAYLQADKRLARRVSAAIRTKTKRKVIGLCWRSGNQEYGGHKSMTLFDLAPLIAREDVVCVNLQYGDTRDEREALKVATGLEIADVGADLQKDLESVAAIMAGCDAIVTVSNTHAHLAGALGCRTLLALPKYNARFWYWFLDRTDSPWYPAMKIYRQARHGRWDDVVETIGKELIEPDGDAEASKSPP